MQFMVIERFRTPGAVDVYRRARDEGRHMPDNIRYVASWVDHDFTVCYQIMEADSAAMLEPWLAKWRDLVDFQIIPVRTSQEASRVIAPLLDSGASAADQSHAISVRRVSGRPIAAVKAKVPLADLPDELPMLLGRVYAAAKAHNVALDGQNIVVYKGSPIEFEVEAGVGVEAPFASTADLHSLETPAGEAAVTTHRGDFTKLPQAHLAIDQWCKANGRTQAGVRWEVYGHMSDAPDARRTEVYHLLR